jgi:Kef-type K+ transport system membrane component KefB
VELPVLVQLFVLFAAAKLAGEAAERIHQPAVVGELLVGMVLGAGMLGVVDVGATPFLREFAELCVVILLFRVGLETRLSDIRAVGGTALLVAIAGVVVPFALGYGFYRAIGADSIHALFLGAALVATSVGVTARVLSDLRLLGERESRIILGAAVIDDILGLLVLSVVAGAGRGGGIQVTDVAITVGLSLAFLAVFAVFGTKAVRIGGHLLERPRVAHAPFAFAAALCLGVAALAQVIGLAAIVGAWLAGMVMAESPEHYDLEEKFEPLGEFLVPFFFVITGASVDPTQFLGGSTLALVAAVVGLAAIGKLVACGLASSRLGLRSAAIVGVGMIPRGEVGIIVANEGARAGAVDARTFAVIVAMSILTTLIVPPVLKALFGDRLSARSPRPARGTG